MLHPEPSAGKTSVQAGIPCTGTGNNCIIIIFIGEEIQGINLLGIGNIDLPEELSTVQRIDREGEAQRNPVNIFLWDFIDRQDKPEFEAAMICRYNDNIHPVVINNGITSRQETHKKYPDNSVQFHG